MISLNTKEYWPIFIGFSWFTINLILRTTLNVGPVDLQIWNSNENFIKQITNPSFLITQFLFFILTYISVIFCHKSLSLEIHYVKYFFVICLTILSKIIGTSYILKSNGLGKAIWCIIFGFLFRLFFKIDSSRMMSMEFFIKISIVLFAIDLRNLTNLGLKSLIIAWIEPIFILCLVCFIGYVLKLNTTQYLLISVGLSICGSSAVMSISEVLDTNIDSQDISITITILSLFSIPYIILLPYFSRYFNLSNIISGIWIGGSIDSTGAVFASASLVNGSVTNNAIILKMLQNLLIGPLTLGITMILHKTAHPKILLQKFPKFIIGFLIVSTVVSYYDLVLQDSIILSEWFSELSFVLIGMDIYLQDNKITTSWKMILLYIIGQTIDTFTTLGLSIFLFGYI